MRKGAILIALTGIALSGAGWWAANASDHDDGVSDLKSQDVNLTDLYVFREDNQTGVANDGSNLVLIMNSNPRSLPGQQYFFSTQANYDFNVSAVTDVTATPTGVPDFTLRFNFAAPDSTNHQAITYTLLVGTAANAGITGATTATLAESQADTGTALGNIINDGGTHLKVFAGLKEDPFFFDVEAFFKLRESLLNGALATPPTATLSGFSTTSGAADFTHGYNVNSIVVEVPIGYLQVSNETAFDVWITTSIPNPN